MTAMETLGSIHERNATRYPEAEAFVYEGRRVTNVQFLLRARQLGSALYRAGMRSQDRVAVLAMNCLEYMEIYAAGDLSRFITAAINYRLSASEVAYIVNDADPRVVIFEEQYTAIADELRVSFPDIEHWVCIGEVTPPWAVLYEDFVAGGDPAGAPLRSVLDDFSYLIYTSGTTGRPKGVVHTHRAHLAAANATALSTGLDGASRVLQTSPVFHIGGTGYVRAAAMVGAGTVLHRAFDPVTMLQAIETEGITFTFMVPAMLRALVEVPDVEKYDLSSMRSIVAAAAPVPVPLLRRGIELLGPIFQVQYGGTEFGTACNLPQHLTRPDGTEADIRRLSSVGHPIHGIELRVVDGEDEDCPAGSIGEVWFRSAGNLTAYWNNSAATIEALQDGWYKTGDMGYLDSEGYLFLVDRKKDMIISGGENIYSREVEDALGEHPGVAEAAVIGVPHPQWDEAVHAVVVRHAGSDVDAAALIAYCRDRIAKYKSPQSVSFVTELPRLASGKVNKVSLRDQYVAPLP